MVVRNKKTGELTTITADEEDGMFGLFGFIGYLPKSELFEGQVEMQDGYILTDEDMKTNLPGVFAAGDVAHGASTVVHAVATGKRVAEAMHEYMQSLPMPEPSPYADVPRVDKIEASVQSEQIIG